jgi:hypothetical protein
VAPGADGFGAPLGPAEIVTACVVDATFCVNVAVSLSPWPSLAFTWIVQGCVVPLPFGGAVQDGFWALDEGAKVPGPESPGHVADHA